MKRQVFPYRFRLSTSGETFLFPAVLVELSNLDSTEVYSFLVLVDSGAETSLFKRDDAELLGLELEKGKKVILGSASGGSFKVFFHKVEVSIGEERLEMEVAFSENNDTPRLLGRNPFFEHFFVIFDQKRNNTVFIPRREEKFEDILYKNSFKRS